MSISKKNDNSKEIKVLYTYFTHEWFRINFVYSELISTKKIKWLKKYYKDPKTPISIVSIVNKDEISNLDIDNYLKNIKSEDNNSNEFSLTDIIEFNTRNPY